MTAVADQAYLRTRLAIMDSRRRRPHALRQLLHLDTVELCRVLGLNDGSIDQRKLDLFEQAQMQIWLEELNTLLRPLSGPQRALLVQWARRYEVLNIKALVRGKLNGLSRKEISASLFDLPGYLSLDHELLLNADDVMELLRRLLNTPYAQLARLALHRFEEQQDPFLLDASLDQQFYSGLGDCLASLPAQDRTPMHDLIGRLIDRHNLIWSLRYRHNYGLPAAEVLYLSISGGLQLTGDSLQRILEMPTLQEALERLPAGVRTLIGQTDNLVSVRDRLVMDLTERAEHALRTSESVLTSVFAYLLLRFYEIEVTKAILQARFIALPPGLDDYALFSWYRESA